MSLLPRGPLAALALENGSVRLGNAFGAIEGGMRGEVVFHTGMSGYPEILTDPSYRGQIVVHTYPHLGNHGMPEGDDESGRVQVAGVIALRLCRHPSGVRPARRLEEVLQQAGVMGLEGIDTRALTLELRARGSLRGVVERVDPAHVRGGILARRRAEELVSKARALPPMEGQDLVTGRQASGPRVLEPRSLADPVTGGSSSAVEIVLLDFGVKGSIVQQLRARGCRVRILPAGVSSGEVLSHRPHGVVLSNGPGDPAACTRPIETARKLLGRVPMLGICLGHQILALAAGAGTRKLPFGHHGANHPVREEATGRIAITSQNHGFAVVEESLRGTPLRVSHRSLYDGTVEGVVGAAWRVQGVQYHPEAAPGPHDAREIFDRFLEVLSAHPGAEGKVQAARACGFGEPSRDRVRPPRPEPGSRRREEA